MLELKKRVFLFEDRANGGVPVANVRKRRSRMRAACRSLPGSRPPMQQEIRARRGRRRANSAAAAAAATAAAAAAEGGSKLTTVRVHLCRGGGERRDQLRLTAPHHQTVGRRHQCEPGRPNPRICNPNIHNYHHFHVGR